MADPFLKFSDRITCLPVIHGSGDFMLEVRRLMLDEKFDCVAVPLPPSFRNDVEAAVKLLPAVTMVTQAEPVSYAEPGGGETGRQAAAEAPVDLPAPTAPQPGDRFACVRCGCVVAVEKPSGVRPHQLKAFLCQCGGKMLAAGG